MSINSTEKPKKGRPPVDTEAVNLRLSREMLSAVDDYRRRQEKLPTRPEAIRQLIQRGFDLSLLCIDLLDAIEAEGLLDTGDMKEPVAALEKYLGTSRSGDFPQK